MSNALVPEKPVATVQTRRGWVAGAQRRKLREALLAYLFLLPAFLIVGTFGLFPLVFAAYQSTLRGINKVVGTYDGLGNYVKAISSLTYVLGFWGAVILIFLAIRAIWQVSQRDATHRSSPWPWIVPGVAFGAAIALALVWIIRLLPLLLSIPDKMRGARNTPENFRRLLADALSTPEVLIVLAAAIFALVVGIMAATVVWRLQARHGPPNNDSGTFALATLLFFLAAVLGGLTWAQLQSDIAAADQAGGLDIWSQIVMISAGFVLLLLSWLLWKSASQRTSTVSTLLRLAGAAVLVVGAWMLIAELPRVIGAGDKLWWNGLQATFYYAVGTVPAQLLIALLFAVLLFQDIRGRSFFRVVYFLPFIAPFVGTAAVFKLIFSARPSAAVNQLLAFFGLGPFAWLSDPRGILAIVAPGLELPPWSAGPSLALIVIMVYGVWTFFGFNTVVYLAGLGNIPREMYEAAAIDGGGRWAQFRHITLPLLSPTIYFLTLYSVIGTFKAFNHIYVLRTGAALGTTDTASVVIFQTFKRDTRYGYASALAILLLLIIILLTVINNRIASKRVFYG